MVCFKKLGLRIRLVVPISSLLLPPQADATFWGVELGDVGGISERAIKQDADDDTTKIATTSWVQDELDTYAADTAAFTNKTFDADGTGNNLTNIEVANLKSGVLDIDLSNAAGTDTTLASAKAIKAALDLKAPIATPTFTTSITIGSATVTQAQLEILDGATVTTTELNRLANIDYNVKTEVDLKATLASPVFTTSIRITPQSSAPSSPTAGMIYYDTEDNIAYVWNGSAWMALNSAPVQNATGGNTINTYTGFKTHVFTSDGTFTPTLAGDVDILLVAGGGGSGGGGAGAGGGGGAGGFKYYSQTAVTAGTAYAVVIGSGGSAGAQAAKGGDGTVSTVIRAGSGLSLSATGGGGGGSQNTDVKDGRDGGSGGGGGQRDDSSANYGDGTANEGNRGGSGYQGSYFTAGGGGGASAAAADTTTSGVSTNGGAGYTEGASVYNWASGSGTVTFPALFKVGTSSNLSYAGGGGGSDNDSTTSGGVGGGGNGASGTGADGDANTGGGAGGNSSDGGSGIVIIRYAV